MRARYFFQTGMVICLTLSGFHPQAQGQYLLGEASHWTTNLTVLPGPRTKFQTVTGGFVVSTDARERVRDFYNAIYPTSKNVPINSTTDVADCFPGTNSPAFQQAVLRRINWFRALAGDPANVSFDPFTTPMRRRSP